MKNNSLADEEQTIAYYLAPHIHEYYREMALRLDWPMPYDMEFDLLPSEVRAEKRAAARRIPTIFSLYVIPTIKRAEFPIHRKR